MTILQIQDCLGNSAVKPSNVKIILQCLDRYKINIINLLRGFRKKPVP